MGCEVATFDRFAAAASHFWPEAPRRRLEDVTLYLAHVEGALSLRAVSRASGKALATVHRAVRRIEALRDDPLMDRSLENLGDMKRDGKPEGGPRYFRSVPLDPARRAAMRSCLTAMMADGAFLLVADGAGRAGVFCRSNAFRRPVHVVSTDIAADLVARNTVRCVSRTAASAKYVATPEAALWLRRPRRAAERRESRPTRLAARLARCGVGAERADALKAAHRLHDDLMLAGCTGADAPAWSGFAMGADAMTAELGDEPAAARGRAARALAALGPGLADVVYAVCGRNEPLDAVERRQGWSPRSAKVVLGIALDRLAAHYASGV